MKPFVVLFFLLRRIIKRLFFHYFCDLFGRNRMSVIGHVSMQSEMGPKSFQSHCQEVEKAKKYNFTRAIKIVCFMVMSVLFFLFWLMLLLLWRRSKCLSVGPTCIYTKQWLRRCSLQIFFRKILVSSCNNNWKCILCRARFQSNDHFLFFHLFVCPLFCVLLFVRRD